MRVHVLVILLTLLVGCATTAEQANETATRNQANVEQLNIAPCCTPIASLRYVDLRSGRSDVVAIDQSSPIIAVKDGKSYAAVFRAPPRESTKILVIRAFSSGSIMAAASATFFPAFLFFQDNGEPVQEKIGWTIRPARSDWVDRPSLEATIELPPSPTPTRIVVYTPPEMINKRSPIIVDAGVFMVPNGVFGSVRAIWP